jgi:hypothetical protein
MSDSEGSTVSLSPEFPTARMTSMEVQLLRILRCESVEFLDDIRRHHEQNDANYDEHVSNLKNA